MTTIASRELTAPSNSKAMNIGLWAAQGVLGAVFLLSSSMKLMMPVEQLQAQMGWVGGTLGPLVRFIGAVELVGALGVILPAATRIKPWLTPLAALGFFVLMILASLTHVARGELGMLPVTFVIGGLAAFVAWGRSRKSPIKARG